MNSIKGRGAAENPANRFEEIHLQRDIDWNPEDDGPLHTRIFHDTTQKIINYNDSPDVGFDASVNPYRGCEHGCIYCFARPTHEYLGFSSGLDFESKIMVKLDAPTLLRKELSSRSWKPQVIVMSGVTDCYQPLERKLRLTRGCLEVLAEFRNPVCIITKNHLVTRDVELYAELAQYQAAAVNISITTLDPELTPILEPRASLPRMRLAAIRELSAAGVPVGVMVAPVVPGITDFEMPQIVAAAVEAGAKFAGYVPVRLPYAVKDLFDTWLQRHFPDRREKVLNGIRALRDGKLNDPNFGSRLEGSGPAAERLSKLFEVSCRKAGLPNERSSLSTAAFRVPSGPQMLLQLQG
ncbi:MAG: PA0069 family radical SAM protein [Verrucomicrobiota bacterium]|nr:PA0069 family radical SAM protein [Verrucomicrobiota bacterium]